MRVTYSNVHRLVTAIHVICIHTHTLLSHTPSNWTCCCFYRCCRKTHAIRPSPERIFSHFVILNIYFLQYTANFISQTCRRRRCRQYQFFLFDPFCVDLFNQRVTKWKKKQPCYNNTNYIRVSFLSIDRRPRASSHGCRKCCSEELFFFCDAR